MRWLPFVIAAVAAVALDTSDLIGLLSLDGLGSLAPSITGVLVVFVSLFAPRAVALWSAWCLGLLLDICPPQQTVVVGPYALGFVFGAYFVLQLRTMVFRRRVLTIASLSVVCLAAAGLVGVVINTLRSWYPEAPGMWSEYRPLVEFARCVGIAVYSGLLAIPIGWLLMQSAPVWGFHHAPGRGR